MFSFILADGVGRVGGCLFKNEKDGERSGGGRMQEEDSGGEKKEGKERSSERRLGGKWK